MEKSCHSSGQEESSPINPNNTITTTTTSTNANNNNNNNNNKDNFLKQIHKLSHKISKPPLNHHHHHQNIHHHQVQHLPLILDQETRNESQPSDLNLHQNPQQQHQPPVYNVSKSDFRDVVQKLTGSPAHERPVQPVQPVKPQSSRLQRIRPPPLEQIGNRPPPSSLNPNFRPVNGSFFPGQRPLSPLPPLPAVHATAESPISAYMRCFQTNVTGFNPPPPPQLHPRPAAPDFPAPSSPLPFGNPAPSSPLPFGCLSSPKSQFPMLSPGFPFGFQQLTPLSPTPPAPSPRWKAV